MDILSSIDWMRELTEYLDTALVERVLDAPV
jgi:hypothetical protein